MLWPKNLALQMEENTFVWYRPNKMLHCHDSNFNNFDAKMIIPANGIVAIPISVKMISTCFFFYITILCNPNPCVFRFFFFFLSFFTALVQPVKVLKVWPELVPEQLSLLPSLSCGGPGGQVRIHLDAESEDVLCPSGGDDSCCHGHGVLVNS